jgi:hypothetical protein
MKDRRSSNGLRAARTARGSVLVVVLITIVMTTVALIAFIDKASNDLAAAAHVAEADRMRMEAYSAVEVTLAVLEDFREADGGLHTPAEGWGDPLDWAGYTPTQGRKVTVAFADESGKIPLIHASPNILLAVFENAWGMNSDDAQHLADVILTWMRPNYVPTTALNPDYDQSGTPFGAPGRPIRAYSELSSIDYARDLFYDQSGRPNALWWRFYNDFSIFNFRGPNINGANPDVLTGVGGFDGNQAQSISDYQTGTGSFNGLGQQWFLTANDLHNVVGSQVGTGGSFGYTISALRILVTVSEGTAQYRLSVVVAPQGGAKTVQTNATDVQQAASNSSSGETASSTSNGATAPTGPTTAPTPAQTSAAANSALQYPFTILEILENDQIPTEPPPPPAPVS